MSLGDRLKERRVMLNLSRKKLSEITYITPQALANYENGISTPKFEILVSLFQSLECDANYLYQDYLPANLQTFEITHRMDMDWRCIDMEWNQFNRISHMI